MTEVIVRLAGTVATSLRLSITGLDIQSGLLYFELDLHVTRILQEL